jgi:hypothetical protein
MKYLKFLAGSFLLVSMAMVGGCSDDDDPIQLPTLNEAYVVGAVTTYIVPVVNVTTEAAILLATMPKSKQVECDPVLGVCDSGSVEACTGEPPYLEFDQCAVDEFVFDGTLQVAPSMSGYTLGFVDFSVNDLTLTGLVEINMASFPPCVDETFGAVVIEVNNVPSTMWGSLTVCETSENPAGNLTLEIIDPNLGLVTMVVSANGQTDEIFVTIYDYNQELVGTCSVLVDSGSATCTWE